MKTAMKALCVLVLAVAFVVAGMWCMAGISRLASSSYFILGNELFEVTWFDSKNLLPCEVAYAKYSFSEESIHKFCVIGSDTTIYFEPHYQINYEDMTLADVMLEKGRRLYKEKRAELVKKGLVK